MIALSREGFAGVFANLKDEYLLLGPTIKKGRGAYSDTDLCIYDRLDSPEDLVLERRSYFSAKEIAFPISEKLFDFSNGGIKEPEGEIRKRIIFARSCDIEGFLRLDEIYLNNGTVDFYYKRLRKKIYFFLIECTDSFEGCFCQSVGSDATEEYALRLRETEGGLLVQIKDETFNKYFAIKKPEGKEDPSDMRTLRPKQKKVDIPDLKGRDLFEDRLWEEYSGRCIACGRCNLVCPSCSCFSIYDTADDDDNGDYIRKRIWSACQIDGFAKVSGGHEYRIDRGQRMRYKLMHKFHNFKERFGKHMCVGCGRCIEACPEYIDIRVSLEKLNHG